MIETSGNDGLRKSIIQVCIGYGFEPWLGNANWNGVAEVLNITPELARGQYRRLVGWLNDNGYTIEDYVEEISELKSEYIPSIQEVKDNSVKNKFDKLVEATGIDRELFEVEKGSIWGSKHNLSASFRFRRRTVPTELQIENIITRIKEYMPKKFSPIRKVDGEYMALISMYDLQLGRLGADGTGTFYTIEKYKEILEDLLGTVSMYPLEEIVFVLGNDFSDYDNPFATTTKGTQQYIDVGWRYGIDDQCDLAIYTIDRLRGIAPVRVIMVGGNHDMFSNYFLGKYVEAWYQAEPSVTIDNEKKYRKYYQYGNTGFMFTHGNEEKKTALPAIFATEAPEIFSGVTNREVHTGHFHQRSDNYNMLTEEFGVIIRVLPSLAPNNDWEDLKGYILHNRAGIVHVYHKDKNQVAEFYGKI